MRAVRGGATWFLVQWQTWHWWLTDSELGDLQEFLSLRNAGFTEDEICDIVGEEQFSAVQASIARIRENRCATRPATKHKKKSKRRVEVCDIEDVEAEDETEFDWAKTAQADGKRWYMQAPKAQREAWSSTQTCATEV